MRALAFCLVAAAVVPVTGCTDELLTEGATDQAVTANNRIAVNRIAVNRIAVNRIAVNRIAVNSIATGDLGGQVLELDPQSVQAFFENGADGELVLEYLLSCAFPAGVTFRGPSFDGSLRDYVGGIGLAPHWAARKLTLTEKGWISACMISRVNVNAVPIEISLRGPHRALGTSDEEAALFNVEEGAFYGDIFTGEAPIQAFACSGTRIGPTETGGDRQCATAGDGTGTTPCDMRYTGTCATVCRYDDGDDGDDDDDDQADAGYHARCDGVATLNPKTGKLRQPKRFDQVITTFIR